MNNSATTISSHMSSHNEINILPRANLVHSSLDTMVVHKSNAYCEPRQKYIASVKHPNEIVHKASCEMLSSSDDSTENSLESVPPLVVDYKDFTKHTLTKMKPAPTDTTKSRYNKRNTRTLGFRRVLRKKFSWKNYPEVSFFFLC